MAAAGTSDAGRMVVFGGTGFLGSRVVDALREAGAQTVVAARHPGQAEGEAMTADILGAEAVRRVVAGAVGLASLLPKPPISRAMISLMARDNVADPLLPGLEGMHIAPIGSDRIAAASVGRPRRFLHKWPRRQT